MDDLTPKQIVSELDQYIIGQADAKRAVAIAIRNRWRRRQLDADLAKEISPKNIIMIGPTGVGKTEIARRIAGMVQAPFIKIEASKFTEVGYHGRDVESIIRDLLEQAISMVRAEHAKMVQEKATDAVEQKLLDLLLPPLDATEDHLDMIERREASRQKMLDKLRAGKLDDNFVEIELNQKAVPVAMFSNMGLDQMEPDMARMFESLIPDQNKRRKVTVDEARRLMLQEETEALIDRDKMTTEAIERTEQSGIVFLDEIDKIASPSGGNGGSGGGGGNSPDVSRQGVQRDLLPIVEGSAVMTRHGVVNTDHILFIAAGAFHVSSVSDLMPELQGRFPIRVELSPLTKEDFVRILTEPNNALTKQQEALLRTEGLTIKFKPEAIAKMAELAATVNSNTENIGARRLMTIMEKLFEEINFDAPELVSGGKKRVTVTAKMVNDRVGETAKDEDLSKFVL